MSDNAVARLFRSAPVTCSVGALLIAVWLLQAIEARSITRTAAGPVTDAFLVRGPEVIVEPLGALRTLTAVLIHLGLGHLVVNLALFFFVGREIERRLPGGFYLATFVLSGLGSSLAIIVFDPLVPTAGASGAIFGLMAVFVATAFRAGLDVRAPLILLGINIAYTFISAGSVSLWGHLGGAATGAALAGATLARRAWLRWAITALVAFVVIGGILLYSSGVWF
ncbi:rhomboid family intramembrane serine protease [Corynebacterium otitidis]|uniref:Peptidase S54 rhomboid domain-containing protein n=1 Tax=Corynebacterium otitidis ATCC 51513 TaxID=883169 RepID=K0Z1U2_9CORY|nr:rhomboid family intramembrane serine protease [Corynebacterium otitidis]EJZ81290.1 hypothetical protein HMPREF9719_01769 [Corynebacterium otitidis ATCC 51513]KKO83396.1 hypothetical protein AAV33_06740 [Corynebacterium otitidis]